MFHMEVELNACTFCWYVWYVCVLYLTLVQKQMTLVTHAHSQSQRLTIFAMGVPDFEVKFHVLGLPV